MGRARWEPGPEESGGAGALTAPDAGRAGESGEADGDRRTADGDVEDAAAAVLRRAWMLRSRTWLKSARLDAAAGGDPVLQ